TVAESVKTWAQNAETANRTAQDQADQDLKNQQGRNAEQMSIKGSHIQKSYTLAKNTQAHTSKLVEKAKTAIENIVAHKRTIETHNYTINNAHAELMEKNATYRGIINQTVELNLTNEGLAEENKSLKEFNQRLEWFIGNMTEAV
ncbi:MAG TPA: hypothetical protein PLV25_07715, partial [Opitutales bacterium]|nr:hypothetical protein [Opitutales bacterium]